MKKETYKQTRTAAVAEAAVEDGTKFYNLR